MGPSELSPPSSPSGPKGSGDGFTALAYLISGIGLYGGVGWLLDRWLGTVFLLPIGLILGMGLAIYLIVRRYGRS